MSRSGLTLLILATALSCDRRVWTGPLASAAYSAFASAQPSSCEAVTGDLGFVGVRLPLRSCGLVRGDTTHTVVFDDRRRVLILSRLVLVDPARRMAIHDSLQFVLGTVYEAPAICRDGDYADETALRIWKTLDRQIALRNVGDGVVVELRTDHPGCDGDVGNWK